MSYIDDIKKLMDARDRAVNENEAAAAAGIIARLCAKHNISEEEIIGREIEMGAGDALSDLAIGLETSERLTTWQGNLATAIQEATFTSILFDLGYGRIATMRVFGRKRNIETFEYMWMYLLRTIKDIAKEKQGIDRAAGIKRGKSWWNSWYHGCVQAVNDRLRASMKETIREISKSVPGREVMIVNKFSFLRKEALAALNQAYPKTRVTQAKTAIHEGAYIGGQNAGSKISLPGGGISHRGAGPKGLIG